MCTSLVIFQLNICTSSRERRGSLSHSSHGLMLFRERCWDHRRATVYRLHIVGPDYKYISAFYLIQFYFICIRCSCCCCCCMLSLLFLFCGVEAGVGGGEDAGQDEQRPEDCLPFQQIHKALTNSTSSDARTLTFFFVLKAHKLTQANTLKQW